MAEKQHGVFTLRDVRAVGASDDWLRRQLDKGVYRRAAPQTYRIQGSQPTWEQSVMIAVCTAGKVAAASHLTAAHLWGLIGWRPRRIEVTTPRWRRTVRSFVVHESRDLAASHIAPALGIPTTHPARTVVDVAGSTPRMAERVLDAGLRRELFDLRSVARFVAEVARRGRRGVGVVRPLIEVRLLWDGATESELEDEFRRLLGMTAIPAPTPQHEIRDEHGTFVARVDFAYPDSRLVIELDSEAHHMDRRAFRRDRARQNQLELLGWRVLRYTWWDVTAHPHRVVADLQEMLRCHEPASLAGL